MSQTYEDAEASQTVSLQAFEEGSALAFHTKKSDTGNLTGKNWNSSPNNMFEFILVDDSNPERRKKNRSIAHSHVKKLDQRTRRARQMHPREPAKKSVVVIVDDEIGQGDLEELWSDHARSVRSSSIVSVNSQKLNVCGENPKGIDDTSGWISTPGNISPSVGFGFSTALGGVFGSQDRRTRLMLDHSLKVLWPGFMPGVPQSEYHSLSAAWFQVMCRSRALFHTVVVLGARHLDFLHKSTSFSDSALILSHKGRAMRELGDALANPVEACSDENILAMLWMASAEIVPEDRRPVSASAFNPPLPNDQWIDAWSSCVSGTEHSNMMRELIEMRGGLEKIGLFGVTKILSLATTILVTSRLVQPYHPFLEDLPALQPKLRRFVDPKHISRNIINNVTPTYTRTLPDSGDEEPVVWSGFRELTPLGLTEEALGVFRDMRRYNALLEKYCDGDMWTYTRMELIDMRNAVQHRLVSLPLGSDLGDVTMQQAGIYECCRLTVLLYACAVTFPLPTSLEWDRNLVGGIQQTLENLSLESWPVYPSDFHLWVLMLGGIAAFQKAERSWFVGTLRSLAWRKELCDWSQVLPVFKSFLWLDRACEAGGMSLWDEVQGWTSESSPPEDGTSPSDVASWMSFQ